MLIPAAGGPSPAVQAEEEYGTESSRAHSGRGYVEPEPLSSASPSSEMPYASSAFQASDAAEKAQGQQAQARQAQPEAGWEKLESEASSPKDAAHPVPQAHADANVLAPARALVPCGASPDAYVPSHAASAQPAAERQESAAADPHAVEQAQSVQPLRFRRQELPGRSEDSHRRPHEIADPAGVSLPQQSAASVVRSRDAFLRSGDSRVPGQNDASERSPHAPVLRLRSVQSPGFRSNSA